MPWRVKTRQNSWFCSVGQPQSIGCFPFYPIIYLQVQVKFSLPHLIGWFFFLLGACPAPAQMPASSTTVNKLTLSVPEPTNKSKLASLKSWTKPLAAAGSWPLRRWVPRLHQPVRWEEKRRDDLWIHFSCIQTERLSVLFPMRMCFVPCGINMGEKNTINLKGDLKTCRV